MIRRLTFLKIFIRAVFFILTTYFLGYYSGVQKWNAFTIVFIAAALLYIISEILESKWYLNKLEKLEAKEFQFAIKGERFGLEYFYNLLDTSDAEKRVNKIKTIIQQGNEIKILSLTAMTFLNKDAHTYFQDLEAYHLRANKVIKVLIINPKCIDKQLRDLVFASAKSAAKNAYDLHFRLKLYKELVLKYTNLEIRVTDYCIYSSMFISGEHAIAEPYFLAKVNSDNPNKAFALDCLRKSGDTSTVDYFRIFESHYHTLWSHATPVKEFLVNNPEFNS